MESKSLSKTQLKKQAQKDSGFIFYKFPNDIQREGVDYSWIIEGNLQGLEPWGRKKLIDFFLSQPMSYRKIVSFILLQQKLNDKHVRISDESICKFSGEKKEELLHTFYFLKRKVSLLKGIGNVYRIPGFLYKTEILKEIKDLQNIGQEGATRYKD